MDRNSSAISNIKLVFAAQIFVVIVNIIRTLFIPKVLSIQEYGYWQTYLLYVSYISVFFLGFNDGVYLKCVGWNDDDYINHQFSSVYFSFGLLLIVETIIVCLALLISKTQYLNIYILVALNIPEMGLLGTTSYYYQLTGRMKNYTLSVVAAKILFLFILLAMVFSGTISSNGLMWTDFIASLIVLIYILIREKRVLVFGKHNYFNGIKGTIQYIRAGYSVMLGAYIALLFSGVGKIFIQNTASIEEFSYYSFALSISNIIIVCFGSIGLALYPEIVKAGSENYGSYYLKIERMIDNFTPLMLLSYYFAYIFVSIFLPIYLPAMGFLGLSFVVVILQLKINVLNNTFYKVLRLEKRMLFDNVISLLQLLVGCLMLKNAMMILYCQILVMIYRVYRSKYLFANNIHIKSYSLILQLIIIACFLMCLHIGKIGFVIFALFCAIFCICKYKDLFGDFKLFILRRRRK